ncbi:MAG: hypothetical protein R2794_01025 [Chitinophagales bacterium]
MSREHITDRAFVPYSSGVHEQTDARAMDSGVPGIEPFVRGPYSTMYVMQPGRCDNTRDFPRQKKATLFTEKIWRQDKKD